MRLKNKLFLIVFLLAIPFALATTIDLSQDDAGKIVITGICDDDDVFVSLQASIGINTVWVGQVTSILTDYESGFNPPQDATYSVYAACQGEGSANANICIGAGCTTDTGGQAAGTSSSGSSGKGSCHSFWSCPPGWGKCNATFKQTRSCKDINCYKSPKIEVQDCEQCEEDWLCQAWTTCAVGSQSRICHDQSSCGTTFIRPVLERNCDTLTSVPSVQQPLNQFTEPEPERPMQVHQPSFIQKYLKYIIGGILGLIFLISIIFVIIHFVHKKPVTPDINDLKKWVKKEKDMGRSDEYIEKILAQQTGWKKSEITEAFQKPK